MRPTVETPKFLRDAALAAATDGIVIVDVVAEGQPILYVNGGFERLTGWRADEVLGRNCGFLQGPGTPADALAEFHDAIVAGRGTTVVLRNYRKDGTPFWNEVRLSPLSDGNRVTSYVGVLNDVTERREAEDRAAFLLYHDVLTGLANRARLLSDLERRMADESVAGIALLNIDLDGFHAINDRFGQAAGDEMLRRVADRLTAVTRTGDLLARNGGDEFLLAMSVPGGTDAAELAAKVAGRAIDVLREPHLVLGDALAVSASIGIATFPAHGTTPQALLQHAVLGAAEAKRAGGGRAGGPAATRVMPTGHVAPVHAVPAGAADELDRILSGDLVRSLYQPIVDIETEAVVAYEALARGPEGSILERPDLLFAAGRASGRLAELDWACRAAAVRGALAAGLRPPVSLFVNVEPSVIADPMPDRLRPLWDRATRELSIVVELTERAVTDSPGDILNVVPRLRRHGIAIAVDDVGADRRSLAIMPFLTPEVVKLDLRLVQDNPTPEIASIVHAVNATAERSDAVLLAEGIETAAQRDIALALGARYAQGWFYGRPAPLPAAEDAPDAPPAGICRPHAVPAPDGRTPYEIVSASLRPRRGSKRLLFAISKHLEAHVAMRSEAAVLLSTFQEARHFTPKTLARYTRLAGSAAFVGALGVGLPSEPAPGVRGAALDSAEPLRGEWNVIVIDPHFAAAFVARDLGDEGGPDLDRRFDFCLTYDRDLVVRAAEAMMARVAAVGT